MLNCQKRYYKDFTQPFSFRVLLLDQENLFFLWNILIDWHVRFTISLKFCMIEYELNPCFMFCKRIICICICGFLRKSGFRNSGEIIRNTHFLNQTNIAELFLRLSLHESHITLWKWRVTKYYDANPFKKKVLIEWYDTKMVIFLNINNR